MKKRPHANGSVTVYECENHESDCLLIKAKYNPATGKWYDQVYEAVPYAKDE